MSRRRPDPLPPDRRGLAEDPELIRRARRIAGRVARTAPHLAEDLESAALLGLVHAARTWDPSAGVPFSAHAAIRCRGEAREFRRKWGATGTTRRRSTRRPPAAEPLVDVADDAPPVGWEVDSADAVDAVARRLPPRVGEAVRRRFLCADGRTFEGVGRAMGLSTSGAQKLIDEAAGILRRRHPAETRP
jgi:DNA-directed RNA polymerase specialized sigma subunit